MKKILSIFLLIVSANLAAQQTYRITRLEICNSGNSEIAPVIYKNGIVFSSDKKSSIVIVTTDQNNNYPYNLYFVEKKGSRKWGRPKPFSNNLTSKLSESSATFSADFNTMYITQSLMANAKVSEIQNADTIRNGIFECSATGEEWIVSQEFYFNDTEFDVAFPALSPDGAKLYFASREPGGYGGYDIYVSEKSGDSWSTPKNLGSIINTSENEVFPFYHKTGRLYFSSRGHGSQGGLDIFCSEIRNGAWINPTNLPRPFNSRQDDFSYVLSARMDTGYFASNRGGSDDIYIFASSFPAFRECPVQVDESFCFYFSETGSMDLDTTSLKYEWDFGDGNKERSTEAEHCYSEVGTYFVSLNVIDTLTGEVYYSEASYNLLVEPLEQPYITVSDTVRVNERFKLNAANSEIRSFRAKDYYWDFGDGNLETGISTDHRYTRPGQYFIRLGITDGEDVVDTEEHTIMNRACSQKQIVVISDQQ